MDKIIEDKNLWANKEIEYLEKKIPVKCECGRRIMREVNKKVGICAVCDPAPKKIDGVRGWVYPQKDYKIVNDYE